MGALELKYDSAYDSWILEPIHVPTTTSDRRHSSAEAFASSRNSCSPTTPPRRSFSLKRWSPAPRYLTSLTRNDNGRLWKSLKQHWNCFKPPTDHNHHNAITRLPKKEKQKIEHCGNNNINNNALTTYYTSMNAQERDENLKAVVLYCNSTSS